MIDLLLRNAATQASPELCDLAVDAGKVVARGAQLDTIARQELDVQGRLVIPGFVEPHLHLDIALMNSAQRPGRTEPFRVMSELNERLERRRQAFTHDDIVHRASIALDLAQRHGITALRAQCHVDLEVGLRHVQALLEVREKYAGRITLQIVAFPQQGLLRPGSLDMFREAFRLGVDVMGCAPNLEPGGTDFRPHIEAALSLAMELDVDLDAHADLALLDAPGLDDLEVVYLARRALETGYVGRVTAGHACALDSAAPKIADQAIQLMAEARMSVISQPDLYRLGRSDRQHVRRGLTRVKQLLAAGVNVALASNNVRDILRPLGNLNPLEEALILAYGAHMDTVDELETLLQMCTYHPARALGLQEYGLEPGCQADLVVLDTSSPSAAVVDQAEKRFVFKAGRFVAATQVVGAGYTPIKLFERQALGV